MKRFVVTTLVMLTVGLVTAGADEPTEEEAAQLTGYCGEIKNRNASSQFGNYLWLEYIVETARPVNSFDCPWLSVSVEAWVVNVSGSAAGNTGPFTASVRRQIPVPHAGNWQTNGKHYRNYLWFFSYSNGETSSIASITASSDEGQPSGDESGGYGSVCGDDPEAPCAATGANGAWTASPIIIDVDRDGYRLTSLDDGVFFDLDADGTTELVSWTRRGVRRRVPGDGSERQRANRRWFGAVRQPHADLSNGRAHHRCERVRGAQVPRNVRVRPLRA